jgi:hypothetical protein
VHSFRRIGGGTTAAIPTDDTMKNDRFEVILQRNQQSAVLDVLLAIAFLIAAMTTGLAMKTAFGQLSGIPVAAAAAVPGPTLADGVLPCAEPGTSPTLSPVLI